MVDEIYHTQWYKSIGTTMASCNIYKDIIGYLNSKSDKTFKHTTNKTKSLIDARRKEGFCLEDFYRVIDVKNSQWCHDSKMRKYLRPETLFSGKFEGYLDEYYEQFKNKSWEDKIVSFFEGIK